MGEIYLNFLVNLSSPVLDADTLFMAVLREIKNAMA